MAESHKNQAEAQFKKAQRALDGKKATSEYDAEMAAVRAKTEKLKALRLARDAANVVAAPVLATKAKKAKAAAPSLSDWLKNRDDSGHNN